MTFDKHLKKTAENLRESGIRSGMPKGLNTRILSALPDATPSTSRHARTSFPRWAGVVAVVGAVAVFCGYRYDHLHRQSKPLSQKAAVIPTLVNPGDPTVSLRNKVRAAVDRTNIVHLSHRSYTDLRSDGASVLKTKERLDDRWEVWQRKSPYFFREERGGEVLLDDGTKEYHFVPAYTVQDVLRDLKSFTPPVRMPGRDGRPVPTQRQEIEMCRAYLSTQLRPAILQIRPSSGPESFLAQVASTEPEHLLLGTDKRGGSPVVLPFEQSRTFATLLQPQAKTEVRTVTNTLSVDLARKVAGEIDINEVSASIDPHAPHATRIDSQTCLVVDSGRFLPKRSTLTENIESFDSVGPLHRSNNVLRAETAADYDSKIPSRLLTINPPPETTVFEVSANAVQKPVNAPLPAYMRGLAASATVTECDASPDVKYAIKWTLNGKPVRYLELSKFAHLSVQSIEFSDATVSQYISIMSADGVTDSDAEHIAVGVEPVVDVSAWPKELTGYVSVLISGNSPGARIYRPYYRMIGASQPSYLLTIPFTLDLRHANERGASPAPLTVGLGDKHLAMLVAAARSDFYTNRFKRSPIVASVKNTTTNPQNKRSTLDDRERAIYWLNAAIAAANAAGRPGDAKAYAWKLKTVTAQVSRLDSTATTPRN